MTRTHKHIHTRALPTNDEQQNEREREKMRSKIMKTKWRWWSGSFGNAVIDTVCVQQWIYRKNHSFQYANFARVINELRKSRFVLFFRERDFIANDFLMAQISMLQSLSQSHCLKARNFRQWNSLLCSKLGGHFISIEVLHKMMMLQLKNV